MAPWITVLSWHTLFTKRVIHYKFTFVWYSAKQGTTHRSTSHLALCPFFGHERNTDGRAVGWFCWPLLWLLLLRLPATVVPLLLPQNNLLTLLAFGPDSESVSATGISLMASSSSFIYFFPATARDPQSSALFTTMYDSAQFHKRNTSEYEHLLQWKQNRSKATMWLLYKNSSYLRVPKTLHDWQL